MSKIINELFSGLYCPICKIVIEHHIQEIDEGGEGRCDYEIKEKTI